MSTNTVHLGASRTTRSIGSADWGRGRPRSALGSVLLASVLLADGALGDGATVIVRALAIGRSDPRSVHSGGERGQAVDGRQQRRVRGAGEARTTAPYGHAGRG